MGVYFFGLSNHFGLFWLLFCKEEGRGRVPEDAVAQSHRKPKREVYSLLGL